MKTSSAATTLAVATLLAFQAPSTELSAQVRRGPVAESISWTPVLAAMDDRAITPPAGTRPFDEEAFGERDPQSRAITPPASTRPFDREAFGERDTQSGSSSVENAIILSSIGSLAGLVGGLMLGAMAGGAPSCNMVVAGSVGTVLGAAAGATLAAPTLNPERALGGSLFGALAGVIGATVFANMGAGGAAWLVYPIIHGAVTVHVASH